MATQDGYLMDWNALVRQMQETAREQQRAPDYPNNPPVQPRGRPGSWLRRTIIHHKSWRRRMDEKIQKAIAEIRETKDLAESVKKGYDAQNAVIADLMAKVAALQAKVDAGSGVTKEDLDALVAATNELDESNKKIQEAIPQNTGGFDPSANG